MLRAVHGTEWDVHVQHTHHCVPHHLPTVLDDDDARRRRDPGVWSCGVRVDGVGGGAECVLRGGVSVAVLHSRRAVADNVPMHEPDGGVPGVRCAWSGRDGRNGRNRRQQQRRGVEEGTARAAWAAGADSGVHHSDGGDDWRGCSLHHARQEDEQRRTRSNCFSELGRTVCVAGMFHHFALRLFEHAADWSIQRDDDDDRSSIALR